MKWMQLFKAGRHQDSEGRERIWSTSDLDRIVAQYNARTDEAPMVLGHPKDDAPAYGWMAKLRRVGDTLEGLPHKVEHRFMEWVKASRYRYRSISLYPDLNVKHIGFLGAMPPAVKGLADVQFSDPEAGGVMTYVEYTGNQNEPEPGAPEMKMYYKLPGGAIVDQEGNLITAEDADYKAWLAEGNEPLEVKQEAKAEPEELLNHKEHQPTKQPGKQPAAPVVFNHAEQSGKIARLEADLLATRRIAALERAQGKVEKLIASGKLTPAQAKGAANFAVGLEMGEMTVEFGESKEASSAQWFWDFAENLPANQDRFGGPLRGSQDFSEENKLIAGIVDASGCGPKK